MIADAELLSRYADRQDQAAFAELVQRHLNLVYSAALRQVHGDAHLAQDVTQLVFTDLARKADRLRRHAVLTGWLYTGTRYAALQAIRTAQRRLNREQEAQHMHDVSTPTVTAADWQRLQPVLDQVMHDLGERDREAVLLRFFEGRAFAEIGAQLGLTEEAARKRVSRALDALRDALSRRGVTSTAGALGFVLAERAVAAAPAGLGLTVTNAAVATATAAASAGALSLWQLLTGAKVLAGAAAALVVGGTFTAVMQQRANDSARAEAVALEAESRTLAAALTPAGRPADIRALEQRIASARDAAAAEARARAAANAQRTAASRATSAGSPTSLPPDPARDRLLRRSAIDRSHAALLRSLALPAEQQARLIDLLIDRSFALTEAYRLAREQGIAVTRPADQQLLARAAHAGVDARIAELLGPAKFSAYEAYGASLPARYVVNSLVEQLRPTATPLSDAQADTIAQTISAHAPADRRNEITEAAVAALAPQLQPAQLAALREEQAAGRALRELMERNRVAASEGRLLLNEQSLRDYPPPAGSPADGAPTGFTNLGAYPGVRVTPASLIAAEFRDSDLSGPLGLYARLSGRQLDIATPVLTSGRKITVAFKDLPPNSAASLLRHALLRAGVEFIPLGSGAEAVRLKPLPSS